MKLITGRNIFRTFVASFILMTLAGGMAAAESDVRATGRLDAVTTTTEIAVHADNQDWT
ncbi:hypothetical protein ACFYU9_29080 [Streptomyces sp. NPDC004327]|uniref:hypothetical protein n=1 Tax=unclassified Streptomyces TaxID=2593676 RepID=UPI00369979D8